AAYQDCPLRVLRLPLRGNPSVRPRARGVVAAPRTLVDRTTLCLTSRLSIPNGQHRDRRKRAVAQGVAQHLCHLCVRQLRGLLRLLDGLVEHSLFLFGDLLGSASGELLDELHDPAKSLDAALDRLCALCPVLRAPYVHMMHLSAPRTPAWDNFV